MRHLKIEQLLLPLVTDLGYELWACDYISQGKHSVLRIYIDTDNPQGITIEDCTKVSHEVSAVLDVEDPINSNYSLEVSSPGMDRPMFKAEHYQRFIDHEVFFKLSNPIAGRKKINGTVKQVDGNTLTIAVNEGMEECDISNIVKANLIV